MEEGTSQTIVVSAQDCTNNTHSGADTGIEISIVKHGNVTNIVDSSGNTLTSREDDVIAVLGQLFESAEDTIQHMAEQIATKPQVPEPAVISTDRLRPFVCECGKTYTCMSHLKYHQKVHSNIRPYTCEICNQSFLQLGHLKRHVRIHTQDKPFACDMCNKSFRQSSHLTCHKRIHTNEKPYCCEVCGMGFRQKSAVFRHISRKHVKERHYVCTICNRGYSGEADLRRHEKTHVNITYFAVLNLQTNTSKICGHIQEDENFATSDAPLTSLENKENKEVDKAIVHTDTNRSLPVEFNKPKPASTEPRPFSCSTCGKTYKNKGHLMFHSKVHLADRPFKCPYCNKGFIQKGHLQRHVMVHTEEKPYVCTVCNKVFRQVSHLNDHKKIHDDLRPNVCDVCNKGFRQTSALKRHMIRMHATHKAYACPNCPKNYRLESDLKRHQMTSCNRDNSKTKKKPSRSNSGETGAEGGNSKSTGTKKRRPCKYKCDICSKPFRSRSEIKVHMRTHTNERPFQCGICHKVFKLLTHLKDHMLIHTGERPFTCNVCNSAFRRDSALRRHLLRMHSKDKRHVCKVCSKAYASPVDMRRHQKSHLKDHSGLQKKQGGRKKLKKLKKQKKDKKLESHPQEDGSKEKGMVQKSNEEGMEQEDTSVEVGGLQELGNFSQLEDRITNSADGEIQQTYVGSEGLADLEEEKLTAALDINPNEDQTAVDDVSANTCIAESDIMLT
ncbi:zinc finger protein 502-like [Acanthaster planci]|uniref:Zinc finger protein 502-like n=1 Tax=Acanthaster planci TaxID=133434 RepID=A0A8B7ZWJ4_ACAPL|nr:zinc finger protein 502-like [Acanthaster planci]